MALDGFDHYIDNLNKGSEEVLTLSVHEPRPVRSSLSYRFQLTVIQLIMLAQSLDASLQDLMLRPPHLRQRSLTDFPYHLAFARRPEGQRHISIGKLQRWTQEYEQQLLRSPGRTVRIGVETPEYRDSWPLAAAASVV